MMFVVPRYWTTRLWFCVMVCVPQVLDYQAVVCGPPVLDYQAVVLQAERPCILSTHNVLRLLNLKYDIKFHKTKMYHFSVMGNLSSMALPHGQFFSIHN